MPRMPDPRRDRLGNFFIDLVVYRLGGLTGAADCRASERSVFRASLYLHGVGRECLHPADKRWIPMPKERSQPVKRITLASTVILILAGGFMTGHTLFGQGSPGQRFEVTVTNITNDQIYTPLLVASHRRGVRLFELGQAASAQLAILAEEGDVGPLSALLLASPGVLDVANSGPPPAGFVPPGESKTVSVATRGNFDRVSVAAMLIPTNDGFFALNGTQGPSGNQVLSIVSPAYDAGSEVNDELCASIPGPFFVECGGPGGGAQVVGGEEGYVHVHRGIHGTGSLLESSRDWRNPVARIVVRRLN